MLVEVILLYTVIKFRNSERALPTKENRRLEITWTIATAIILLFVGVASYQVMASPYVTAEAGDQAALQERTLNSLPSKPSDTAGRSTTTNRVGTGRQK